MKRAFKVTKNAFFIIFKGISNKTVFFPEGESLTLKKLASGMKL